MVVGVARTNDCLRSHLSGEDVEFLMCVTGSRELLLRP